MSENKITQQDSISKENPLQKKDSSLHQESLKNYGKNTDDTIISAATTLFSQKKDKLKQKFSREEIDKALVNLLSDDENNNSKQEYAKTKDNIRQGSTQDFIPLKEVADGMIITTDGKYIGVIEVFPINFYKKSIDTIEKIAKNFSTLFRKHVDAYKFLSLADYFNPQEHISYIKRQMKQEKSPEVLGVLDDYINTVIRLSSTAAVNRRTFILWQYGTEPDDRYTNDYSRIRKTMDNERKYIMKTMMSCGNICHTPTNYNMFVGEFLYYFFNRKTSFHEDIETRMNRLYIDQNEFNSLSSQKKKVLDVDIIAPKGIKFTSRKYLGMDGIYYSFLTMLTDSYPDSAHVGWIDSLYAGPNMDISINCKQIPNNIIEIFLHHKNKNNNYFARRRYEKNKTEAAENTYNTLKADTETYNQIKSGQLVYKTTITIVIHSDSPRVVDDLVTSVTDHLAKYGIRFEDTFDNVEENTRLYMPFFNLNGRIFRENSHDMTTESLSTMYYFTNFKFYNQEGIVIGKTEDGEIVAFNNSDTSRFPNGNMIILGTSGSGKSFNEMLLGSRYRLQNMRVMYVIPKKGYEYYRACKRANGALIQLYPGSNVCINPLGIRAEKEINLDLVSDDINLNDVRNVPLMNKQITFFCAWLSSQMDGGMTTSEYGNLKTILVNAYAKKGINEKNSSIYDNDGQLKEMPIIGDIYNDCKDAVAIKEKGTNFSRIIDALETYVNGPNKDLNGQTNVDLYNMFQLYDVDEDVIGKDLHAAYLLLAFYNVYSIAKSDTCFDIIFLDEVWKMQREKRSAEQVDNIVKIIRGYGGCVIQATQELGDYLNHGGQTTLNNSEIKLILKMNDTDLNLLKSNMPSLTKDDVEIISNLNIGEGYFMANGEKFVIDITASEKELRAFNTDQSKEKKWAEEENRKNNSSTI